MAQGKTSTESVSTLKSVAGTSVDTLSTTASDDLFARTKNRGILSFFHFSLSSPHDRRANLEADLAFASLPSSFEGLQQQSLSRHVDRRLTVFAVASISESRFCFRLPRRTEIFTRIPLRAVSWPITKSSFSRSSVVSLHAACHATGFLQSLEWRTSKKFPTSAGPSKVGHEKQTDDSDSDSAYFSAHASLMHCNTDDPTARDYLAMVSSGSENEDYVLAPQEAVENKKSFYASSTNCGVWLKEVAKARRRQFGENEPSDEKTRRSQSSISLKLPNIEELVDGKWTALTDERNDDDVMWFPLDGRHEQESTRVSSFSGGLHLADVNVKCELLNKLVKLKSLPAKTEPNCHVYQSNSNSRLTFRVF